VLIECSREHAVGYLLLVWSACTFQGVPAEPIGVRYAPGGHVGDGVARKDHACALAASALGPGGPSARIW
jgi:hypothetical protein